MPIESSREYSARLFPVDIRVDIHPVPPAAFIFLAERPRGEHGEIPRRHIASDAPRIREENRVLGMLFSRQRDMDAKLAPLDFQASREAILAADDAVGRIRHHDFLIFPSAQLAGSRILHDVITAKEMAELNKAVLRMRRDAFNAFERHMGLLGESENPLEYDYRSKWWPESYAEWKEKRKKKGNENANDNANES